jgi:hypothetical protein
MDRLSSVDMQCVKAARFYHAPGISLLWSTFDSAGPYFDQPRVALLPDQFTMTHITSSGNQGARSRSA